MIQPITSTNTDFKATEIREDLPRGKYVQGYGKNKKSGLFIKLSVGIGKRDKSNPICWTHHFISMKET